MVVRTANNLEQWLKFFLVGVIETANKSTKTLKSILELKERFEGEAISSLGKRVPLARKFLKHLYKQPLVTAGMVSQALNVSLPTATSIIAEFENLGILKELTGYKRNRIFSFEEYFKLFN
jgi:Fic family protein